MTSTAVTTRAVGGALRLPDLPDLAVTVLLRHRADEPALVRMVVVLADDHDIDDDHDSAELVVARGLLTSGLSAPVADGDVEVAARGGQVTVTVAGLGLELALADVVDLLLASYEAAPEAHERDRVIALVDPVTEPSRT